MQKSWILFCFSFLLFVPFSHAFASTAPDPQEIIRLVNVVRVSHNLPIFTQNTALDKAAGLKASEIANIGALVHTETPDGVQWQNTSQSGYVFQKIGENLATNIEDPQALVTAWMNSPVHRVNILNPTFVDIGVATVPGVFEGTVGSYTVEYTANPKVVEIISPLTQSAPQKTTTNVSAGVASGSTNNIVTTTVIPSNQERIFLIQQIIALLQELLIMKASQ